MGQLALVQVVSGFGAHASHGSVPQVGFPGLRTAGFSVFPRQRALDRLSHHASQVSSQVCVKCALESLRAPVGTSPTAAWEAGAL